MKIAFYDTKPYDIEFFRKANENYGFELTFFEYKLNEKTAQFSNGFDVICAFVNDTIDKKTIDVLYKNNIKMIAMRCAGYNNVDFKAAHGKIKIVRVPSYSPYAVAEHAMALLMAVNRKLHKAYSRTRDGNFSINGLLGFDLNEKTVGIIGTGKIGKIFADICIGFNMNVIAYDKYPKKDTPIKYVDLDTLFEKSDIISLHCPLLKDTHHIISKESIDKMKDGVVIINTSRGGLIDSKALIKALRKGKVKSAGLDVYEEETDYFFEDFSNEILMDDNLLRLLSFPNVIITSHQAFFTKEALENIAKTTFESILQLKEERKLENEICYGCN